MNMRIHSQSSIVFFRAFLKQHHSLLPHLLVEQNLSIMRFALAALLIAALAVSIEAAFTVTCKPTNIGITPINIPLTVEQLDVLAETCASTTLKSIGCGNQGFISFPPGRGGYTGSRTIKNAVFNAHIFSPTNAVMVNSTDVLQGCVSIVQQCSNLGIAVDSSLGVNINLSGAVTLRNAADLLAG